MIKRTLLVLTVGMLYLTGCGKTSGNNDSSASADSSATMQTAAIPTIDSDTTQMAEAEPQLPDEEMLKARIKVIWKALPIDTGKENGVRTAFTESFASSYLGMVKRIRAVEKRMGDSYYDDEEAMMTDGEMIYSWYGAQDPDPNGKFVSFNFTDKTPTSANVIVKRKNGPETETFQLKLKLENGKWMLDDFKSEYQSKWSKSMFNSYRR